MLKNNLFFDKMNIKKIKLIQRLFFTIISIVVCFDAIAQNNTTYEILPYKDIDGYIIIRASIGGTEGNFLLDSRGRMALTEQAAAERGMKAGMATPDYPRAGYEVIGQASAIGFYIGKTIYAKNINIRILKPNQLITKLKVDGIIGFEAFINQTITINSKNKTIILSTPYKPTYIKLINRDEAQFSQTGFPFIQTTINGKTVNAIVDFYEDQPLIISQADAELISIQSEYASIKLAGVLTSNVKLTKGDKPYSIIGRSLLNNGLITFDIGRNKYYFQSFNQGEEHYTPELKKENIVIEPGKVNAIDRVYFLTNIYDYKNNKEWKTIGNKPVVIDFWATWCGPCMKMMPIMDELAKKYKDKILFYKINIDKEGELRQVFEANAIPLVIFGPLNGDPVRTIGADSKEKIEMELLKLIK